MTDYESKLILLTSLAQKNGSKYESGWFLWLLGGNLEQPNETIGFRCLICNQEFSFEDMDVDSHGDFHISNSKLAAFI